MLHVAAAKGHECVVAELLLREELDVNAMDNTNLVRCCTRSALSCPHLPCALFRFSVSSKPLPALCLQLCGRAGRRYMKPLQAGTRISWSSCWPEEQIPVLKPTSTSVSSLCNPRLSTTCSTAVLPSAVFPPPDYQLRLRRINYHCMWLLRAERLQLQPLLSRANTSIRRQRSAPRSCLNTNCYPDTQQTELINLETYNSNSDLEASGTLSNLKTFTTPADEPQAGRF